MAWDYAATASDGNWYLKSRLYIVDVTSESAPSVKKAWQSTDDSFTWNQFLSYAVINNFTNNIGWFWVSDYLGACSIGWGGVVDSNLGLASLSGTGNYSGTFPAIAFNSNTGISDYAAGVRGGDAGGWLMPVWPQAVPTSASCVSCQGTQYSNAAKLTRILP